MAARAEVRLSELFAPGKNSLVIYSMMFPSAADDTNPGPPGGQTALLPLAEGPCPSCTALLDQLDGAAARARQPDDHRHHPDHVVGPGDRRHHVGRHNKSENPDPADVPRRLIVEGTAQL
jgi:hypothetical protein